jgi:hypothetical protein
MTKETLSEKRYTQSQVDLKLMTEKLTNIEKKVIEIDRKLEAEYVTKDQLAIVKSELELLQRIVYGVVGLIITAVVGGMIAFLSTHLNRMCKPDMKLINKKTSQ